jgi:peroxiredoxin
MKKISIIILFNVLSIALSAQDGCEIRVKIANYNYDTLWLGGYFGKRTTPIFFVRRSKEGDFLLKKDHELPEGLYAILTKKNKNARFEDFSVWILNGQRNLSIEADFEHLKTALKTDNSPENEQLFHYFTKYDALEDSLNDLTLEWKSAQNEASFAEMLHAERNLQAFQDEIIAENPTSRTGILIKNTRFLTAPESEKSTENLAEKAAARLNWQRAHFFDNMNLAGDDLLNFPLWVDRLDYFAFKLSSPEPESMIFALENALERLEPNTLSYQYYFRYVMQSLGRITRFRTDEVYVYFTKKYVDGGKANWMKTTDIERYRDDAQHLEPLFSGKKSPDVSFFDQKANVVSIYGTKANYLLVIFYLHDCSHCKREVPTLVNIYQKYQSKGLKVMAICGKAGDEELPKCWQFAEKTGIPADWLLLADPKMQSNFNALLNISGYPRFFLLDENKVILYKQSGELPEKTTEREFERFIK